VVIFNPKGAGPFPLLVVISRLDRQRHDTASFKESMRMKTSRKIFGRQGLFSSPSATSGRGSRMVLDEGFYADSHSGYTCEPERSLAVPLARFFGFSVNFEARAGQGAAPAAGVADEPILMSGSSRGRCTLDRLRGDHRTDVAGVINFVGGWITRVWNSGEQGRQHHVLTARRGFRHSTLLGLSEFQDRIYSLGHSGENIAASGGRRERDFPPDDMPDGGRVSAEVTARRSGWPYVNRYLDEIRTSGRR